MNFFLFEFSAVYTKYQFVMPVIKIQRDLVPMIKKVPGGNIKGNIGIPIPDNQFETASFRSGCYITVVINKIDISPVIFNDAEDITKIINFIGEKGQVKCKPEAPPRGISAPGEQVQRCRLIRDNFVTIKTQTIRRLCHYPAAADQFGQPNQKKTKTA